MTGTEDNNSDIDKPPFFKTWAGMYRLVLGTLLALILIFYAFSKYFE